VERRGFVMQGATTMLSDLMIFYAGVFCGVCVLSLFVAARDD
jgi:hypothetical protein